MRHVYIVCWLCVFIWSSKWWHQANACFQNWETAKVPSSSRCWSSTSEKAWLFLRSENISFLTIFRCHFSPEKILTRILSLFRTVQVFSKHKQTHSSLFLVSSVHCSYFSAHNISIVEPLFVGNFALKVKKISFKSRLLSSRSWTCL